MGNPFRQINKASRQANRAINAPQRQARRVLRQPGQQVRRAKSRARRLQQAPRRMKNQALRPVRGMQRDMNYMRNQAAGGRGRSGRAYKRRPDRMAPTDFGVSAMLYPFGFFLTPIGGMIADWDTAYIRYHLAHARLLSLLGFIFVPIAFVLLLISPPLALIPIVPMLMLWGYAWYLGFQAYGGSYVYIPILSGIAERRGMIDFETLEQVQDEQMQQMYQPGYGPSPGQGMPPPPDLGPSDF